MFPPHRDLGFLTEVRLFHSFKRVKYFSRSLRFQYCQAASAAESAVKSLPARKQFACSIAPPANSGQYSRRDSPAMAFPAKSKIEGVTRMTQSWRFSTLIDRHRALGSKLEDWSGMGTAWSYSGDADEEYVAIRTKAGLMDVSGLKKVHITGPHAAAPDRPRHHARRREDLSRQVGLCLHAERGRQVHRRLHHLPHRPELLDGRARLRHRPRGTAARPRWAATCRSASTTICTICRCRGRSPSTTSPSTCPASATSPYFHHMQTQLFGLPVMISRTGYTGERGYEIFCRGQDAGTIWDRILDEGKPMGIIPCRFTTLDMLRVESYLLFYPYDNSPEISLRRRRPRRHAVGTRPRLHGQPRQDRLSRRRGALSPEGQGALQDLRRAARRQRARRRRRAGAGRRQAGRRRHLRHVFAARQEIDGHRAPVGRQRRARARRSRSSNKSGVIKATAQPLPFDDPKKTEAHAPRADRRPGGTRRD